MSKALVIVDVQKEFDEYIQHDLVDALSEYAEKFDTVYQIWDTHNNSVAPTHSFPGQIDSVPKKFGKKHFSDEVQEYIKNLKASSTNGRTFKLSDDEGYVVRVKNNHDWFYVNPEIAKLIHELKGRKIILAGGADGECLEDIYQAFLAFGLNVHINKKYTYSAKTSQEDSVQEKILIPPPPGYKINEGRTAQNADEICVKINSRREGLELEGFATEKFAHNTFMSFVKEYPCFVFINIKFGGVSWIPPNLDSSAGFSTDSMIVPDVTMFEDVYEKIFSMNDILQIRNIITSGKIVPFVNYSPKKFIRE